MADLIRKLKTLDINRKLLSGELDQICSYPYAPQKNRFLPQTGPSFPCAEPEALGLSSAHIESFFRGLELRGMCPHSALILRRGYLVAEGYWKPFCAEYPQAMYSLSKSVTGMAVALAAAEGYVSLDDKLSRFFPIRGRPVTDYIYKPVTIRHLLTMTSGVDFNELGSFTDHDWVEAFLSSDRSFEPGSQFFYNSLNSYLLSALVCKTTGQTLTEFLTPRLWEPLGIGVPDWETCPAGIEKGGWGLNLTTRGMAALGQLMLCDGTLHSGGTRHRILPKGWVREATAVHTATRKGDGGYGYGYQLWICSPEGDYQFNGAFGQILMVIPRHEMVVAVTAGAPCSFLTNSPSEVIGEYFYPSAYYSEQPLPRNAPALYALRATLDTLRVMKVTPPIPAPALSKRLGIRLGRPANLVTGVPAGAARFQGQPIRFPENRAGLLPFVQQAIHNNFAPGIKKLCLHLGETECQLTFHSADERHAVPVGMDGTARSCELTFHGEHYQAGCTGEWERDEEGRDVLSLCLSFVELPNVRRIRIVFLPHSVTLRFSESPSVSQCLEILGDLLYSHGGMERIFLELAMKSHQIKDSIEQVTAPVLYGIPESVPRPETT